MQTIVNAGSSAEAVLTDATREDDVAGLFDRAVAPGKDLDPVDLVVFDAGNNRRIDFRELSADAFEESWRMGCFAGFLVGARAPVKGAVWMERPRSPPPAGEG